MAKRQTKKRPSKKQTSATGKKNKQEIVNPKSRYKNA
jgi:hypothetical protein